MDNSWSSCLYFRSKYRQRQHGAEPQGSRIKETDRLAREVAALTGETLSEAIRKTLAERLERLRRGQSARLAGRLMEIGRHCAALPDIDPRNPDEIVEYDETGMWR